jgi:hypothetical protein
VRRFQWPWVRREALEREIASAQEARRLLSHAECSIQTLRTTVATLGQLLVLERDDREALIDRLIRLLPHDDRELRELEAPPTNGSVDGASAIEEHVERSADPSTQKRFRVVRVHNGVTFVGYPSREQSGDNADEAKQVLERYLERRGTLPGRLEFWDGADRRGCW